MQDDQFKEEANFNVNIYQGFQGPSIVLEGKVVPRLNARNYDNPVKFLRNSEGKKGLRHPKRLSSSQQNGYKMGTMISYHPETTTPI